jgi:lipoprotein-anchoring transpeptidase ErfK/SrfK
MRKWIFASVASLTLAACNYSGADEQQADGQGDAPVATSTADPLAARDPLAGEQAQIDIPDSEERPTMQAQVVLDRLGFTPGVVDGKEGMSTRNAISGFQEANGLDVTGRLDDATRQALSQWSNIPATRVVTIPASFAEGPYYDIPEDIEKQAELDHLGYESLDEKLAERFHTTVETLKALNPNGRPAGAEAAAGATDGSTPSPSPTASPTASESSSRRADKAGATQAATQSYFRAGQQIRVPNVGGDKVDASAVADQKWAETLRMLGVGSNQPKAARVVVSKSKGTMKVYDQADKLIAMYTATMGSKRDPLPLGEWKVVGEAYNPPFHYNPDLFWDADASDEKATIPPGPNGPVGVVWIDISKEHYGIHGTPAPETIGRAQSHGCVRLTNWDAARLAQMVDTSTRLLFEA